MTDVIDWQDIRLVCGEGKLRPEDVLNAVNIILKQHGITREQVRYPHHDKIVTYAHVESPAGARYRQYARDPLPHWATDVRDEDDDPLDLKIHL